MRPAPQPGSYTVVEMEKEFPFGQLKESVGEETVVLVRKRLIFHSEKELEIIKKMVGFLEGVSHDNLVNFSHAERAADHTVHFYYEYVPLTLEKWVLDLGDDVVEELELAMVGLANYLTSQGIRFVFDPRCLGLSRDIRVKYFLNEFAVDHERKLANFKEVQADIRQFFLEFRNVPEKEEELCEYLDRKSADSANLLASITTRESWDVKSSKSSNSATANMSKNKSLADKIENSKKKSL